MSVSCANCHASLPRYEERGPEYKGCPNCARIRAADEVNRKLLEVLTELLIWLKENK